MRPAFVWLALALTFALATAWLGWWTLPIVGVFWGAVGASGDRAGLSAATAAAAGWAALLAWSATQGPMGELVQKVGAIFGLPAPLFVVVTLAYAALLAGSAADLAGLIRAVIQSRLERRRADPASA